MKIMQCWDDGVNNDAPLADLLRKYRAKATFNIPIHPSQPDRQARKIGKPKKPNGLLPFDEMKDVYKGFLVGGHSMTHPCLSKTTPDVLQRELVESKTFIRDFFGQERCGFAYPCGDYNDTVKQAVRDAGYLYARTTLNVDGALPLSDPMELHPHCHFQSPDFWKKYEAVRELDDIFYFWGHSYEIINETMWQLFDARVERISADPDARWADVVDLFT